MKAFLSRINTRIMADLLQLPPGCEISRIEMPIGRDDILIRVQGYGYEVNEGSELQSINPTRTIEKTADGKVTSDKIDWSIK